MSESVVSGGTWDEDIAKTTSYFQFSKPMMDQALIENVRESVGE